VISEKSLERLDRSTWLAQVGVGRGRLVLFVEDPLFRMFWYSGFQLYANALLIGTASWITPRGSELGLSKVGTCEGESQVGTHLDSLGVLFVMNTTAVRRHLFYPGAASVALGLALLTSCAVNPATGDRQLTLMSEGQEIQMGRDADPDIVASMGLYPDEGLQAYVQALGAQLAARSERPNLSWTFRVLDDPVINAFALPGGYIYVTRGILAYLDSEAELAGVLGHEIGHVTARHSVNQISRAQVAQLGMGVGMILVPELQQFEGLASASLGLLFLKFGRDDERQADELGVRYMGRLGYDPVQLSGVMGMLGRVTAGEGGGGTPEWLSTHPNPENREEAILRLAETAEVASDPPKVVREAFIQRLDGLVFGENPREGFFRGARFYHPDMRFQMDFPSGWQTANTRQAVQAISPQEDAVMALTVGEGTGSGPALRSFLAQEGMQGAGLSESAVNGLPAAAADFRFQTAEETIEGRVLFLEYSGTLLRLLAYGTASSWPGSRAVARAAMESFRPLADPDYLNVEPARIRLVRVPRAIPLEGFLTQQGVQDRGDEVRLLNRLEGNPTLEAGGILKIPTGGRLPGGL
jgi:predicted Zn-dependent protease